MLKLALKVALTFCLASITSSSVVWQRNYSTISQSTKFLNSLKPIKIYSSLHQPSKQKQMLKDLTDQGGIILFLNKNSALYAIEGSGKLANYLTILLKKEYLKLLANQKTASKSKTPLKSHYQELLKLGWKDYELCLLESWKDQEEINTQERLAYYHTKYQPKLNLVRYVALADGKIEAVYQRNNFKTQEQMLASSQKKAILKPLLTYRLDSTSPLSKWQAKAYYENKKSAGIYRWVNRDTKQSYIGSTLNLGQVLYSLDKITTDSEEYPLKKAFREHGLTSFNLQILAYCSPEELAEKEQYYLNLYQPEYNINQENKEDQLIIANSLAKLPTSIIEFDILNKQLVLFKPLNQQLTSINPFASLSLIAWEVKPVHLLVIPSKKFSFEVKTKKTWTLSETTRQKQSLAQKKRTKHPKPGFAVQVQDLSNNTTVVYSSIREAARALNIRDIRISEYLNRNQIKPYKKSYVFTKLAQF